MGRVDGANQAECDVVAIITCLGSGNCSSQNDNLFFGYVTLVHVGSLQIHGTGGPLGQWTPKRKEW